MMKHQIDLVKEEAERGLGEHAIEIGREGPVTVPYRRYSQLEEAKMEKQL